MKKGDRVKLKDGRHGVVHSSHSGPYYGVHIGGVVGFFPAAHVAPEPEAEPTGTAANPDPDSDGDNDTPAAAAWWAQMSEIYLLGKSALG